MRVCPYHPHFDAIGSQLNMPKGLYIFQIFQIFCILMYLAPGYMWKAVELV